MEEVIVNLAFVLFIFLLFYYVLGGSKISKLNKEFSEIKKFNEDELSKLKGPGFSVDYIINAGDGLKKIAFDCENKKVALIQYHVTKILRFNDIKGWYIDKKIYDKNTTYMLNVKLSDPSNPMFTITAEYYEIAKNWEAQIDAILTK
jgi:hypothetical protein